MCSSQAFPLSSFWSLAVCKKWRSKKAFIPLPNSSVHLDRAFMQDQNLNVSWCRWYLDILPFPRHMWRCDSVYFRSQFKAKALNPEIFRKGGLFGVPCKRANPITKPKTPQLATVERFQQKKKDAAQADQGGEGECFKGFHANPLPKDIFERVKVRL